MSHPIAPLGTLVDHAPENLHPGTGTVTVQGRSVNGNHKLYHAGISVMNWPPLKSEPCIVQDCRVSNIGASALGTPLAGTDGAGVWAGQPGTYQRLDIICADWEGLWIGCLARGAVFTDIRIDERNAAYGVGIYVEHAAQDCEISHSEVWPRAGQNAINFEWRYRDSTYASFDELKDGRAGSCRFNVHDCTLHGPIMVDAGSYGHTFKRIKFVGGDGQHAAIRLPNNLPPGKPQSIVESCDFTHWLGPQIAHHNNAIG